MPTDAAVRKREDMATLPTYRNRFESWVAALNAAGLATFDHDDGEERDGNGDGR